MSPLVIFFQLSMRESLSRSPKIKQKYRGCWRFSIFFSIFFLYLFVACCTVERINRKHEEMPINQKIGDGNSRKQESYNKRKRKENTPWTYNSKTKIDDDIKMNVYSNSYRKQYKLFSYRLIKWMGRTSTLEEYRRSCKFVESDSCFMCSLIILGKMRDLNIYYYLGFLQFLFYGCNSKTHKLKFQ